MSAEFTIEQIKLELREFLRSSWPEREEYLQDDDSFFELGLLDSLGMLQVVSFLHEHYGVNMDEELSPEHLDSVSRIARFIASKIG